MEHWARYVGNQALGLEQGKEVHMKEHGRACVLASDALDSLSDQYEMVGPSPSQEVIGILRPEQCFGLHGLGVSSQPAKRTDAYR
jgi:hypothetical protein